MVLCQENSQAKDPLLKLKERWNLKKKFHLLEPSEEVKRIFSLHEASPFDVFEGWSFEQILNLQIPEEHLKIGLVLEIIRANLEKNHLKFCDYDCQGGCELLLEKKHRSCKSPKFLSLRLGYVLCASKHAFHVESKSFEIADCSICNDESIIQSLTEVSGQILSLFQYLEDRKLKIQFEFDESCEIKAKTFVEAVQKMHEKNRIILKKDIPLEESLKLVSWNKEFDQVLMLNLQYELFDLETIDALKNLSCNAEITGNTLKNVSSNFCFTKKQIDHLKSLGKTLSLSKGVANSKWKNLSAKDKLSQFKEYARSISRECFGVHMHDLSGDE